MVSQGKEAEERQRFCVIVTLCAIAVFAAAFLLVANLLTSNQGEEGPARDFAAGEAALQEDAAINPFYVLLIGSDTRKGTALYTGKANEQSQQDQYSDIMTLVRVDPNTFTITLLTIPRDTWLPAMGDKVNAALRDNNPQDVVDAVQELTGTPIEYYMMTTFVSFQTLVNDLGGVTVDVPKKVTVVDPSTGRELTVKAGKDQDLNGAEALVFARARKEYQSNQDALRQVNVRQIEQSMIEAALGSEQDAENAITALEDNVQTNIDFDFLVTVGLDFALHRDQVTIYSGTGPYVGDTDDAGNWVVPDDAETWAALMEAVNAGGNPSDLLAPPKFKK